ncbi:MAG: PilZ domain-containing protein [Pseudomonadota bacterium]
MFWKKKQPHNEPFAYETPGQREAFRYCPDETDALNIVVEGTPHRVSNISAGGLSFVCNSATKGDRLRAQLDLSEHGLRSAEAFDLSITVLDRDPDGTCRCLFTGLTPDQQENIHRYLLIKQKQKIQEKKNRDPAR